jgi:hypothetical protein
MKKNVLQVNAISRTPAVISGLKPNALSPSGGKFSHMVIKVWFVGEEHQQSLHSKATVHHGTTKSIPCNIHKDLISRPMSFSNRNLPGITVSKGL